MKRETSVLDPEAIQVLYREIKAYEAVYRRRDAVRWNAGTNRVRTDRVPLQSALRRTRKHVNCLMDKKFSII